MPDVAPAFFTFFVLTFILVLICTFIGWCINKKNSRRGQVLSAPVVVTSTTHTTHHQQVPGYPINSYPPMPLQQAQGYSMPQPGYPPYPPPQQQPPYPQYAQNATGYTLSTVDVNPPSYDQVVHKQLPYNPNYSGQ